jgi:DNA-binding response OmpR family regulator
LIIVDIPNGIAVCKEIRKNEVTAASKLVVISDNGEAETFKEVGVDCFISKPIEVKILEKELKKLL